MAARFDTVKTKTKGENVAWGKCIIFAIAYSF